MGPGKAGYWRSERIVTTGDEYFAGLIADLDAARTSIDLETYIYVDDPIGRRVCSALSAAAKRGVEVRLLVDGAGAHPWIRSCTAGPVGCGAQVRVFHPMPWLMFPSVPCGWADLRMMLPLLQRLNRRNHRKVCVVDGRVAWVGSFNVSALHCRSEVGDQAWRDTAVRVEGPGIGALGGAFAASWLRSWPVDGKRLWAPPPAPRLPPQPSSPLVRLNDRRGMRRRLVRGLLRRIGQARQRVWIANAYFLPTRRLLAALAAAIGNGADVRLLVPETSDVPFMPWLTSAFYHELIGHGVRIHHYQPGMLHAKTALIDGWATVGSSNLNYRSLFHDLEADVVLLQPASLKAMERTFLADLERSRAVASDDWSSRSLPTRIAGALVLRLRYWM